MLGNKRNFSERQFEIVVGNLLRYGVILATIIVFIGGVFYLIRHGGEASNYQIFHGEPPYFRSPEGVATAAFSGRRRGIIQLGLLLLIITPVARVTFSLLAFMRQRDTTYTIVTLIVLAGLLISLSGN
ncbi:DUF1634 domain-containing protein [Nostoc sp. FACHB-133]|uniref:DUF1634 domain-containing protein n=1 Tax=Nostoc sp. FACHB-133 TaxID=2692835 RepID=UPI0016845596|nr:DUF1634 domain-containing protein [Nostoc sp. FACHB-133]MBD2527403.1 DUF1634 domain-containing protein [Nostoc sp. FACHB-133]